MPLCNVFTTLSASTWNLINDARPLYRSHSVGFRETSITDILIVNLGRYGHLTGECVVHVPSEIETGADFEFVVVNGNWGTHFRMQAKRLYWPQYHYKGLDQSTTDKTTKAVTYQIETLCQPRSNFIPFYLFYNWYPGPPTQDENALFGEGCCLTPALAIKSILLTLGSPYRKNLPFSSCVQKQAPWWTLVCPGSPSIDLSVHALKQARLMGAFEGQDEDYWGEVRRPLSGPYLRLWAGGTLSDDPGELEYPRPIVMVGRR
jgi:hypothetical protein